METNDPSNGTGITVHETANNISKLMDSTTSATTHEEDADNDEALEVSNVSEDEADTDADTSPDQAEEAEDEAEQSETTDEPQPIRLKDGEFIEVNGERLSNADLADRLMIKSEFTRKTQELADKRNEMIANMHEVQVVRNEQMTKLNNLAQIVHTVHGEFGPPDKALIQTNPQLYLQQKEMYEGHVQAVQAIANEQKQLKAENEKYIKTVKDDAQQRAANALREHIPEKFGTPELAGATWKQVTDDLSNSGYGAEEINGIDDPRIIAYVLDSIELREMKKGVANAVQRIEQKPLMKPTGKPPVAKSADAGRKASLSDLRKTGSRNATESWINQHFS
jgi:hypothetical protein